MVHETVLLSTKYLIHLYCLSVEVLFYIDVVECLPVDQVCILAGAGWSIFTLRQTFFSSIVNLFYSFGVVHPFSGVHDSMKALNS